MSFDEIRDLNACVCLFLHMFTSPVKLVHESSQSSQSSNINGEKKSTRMNAEKNRDFLVNDFWYHTGTVNHSTVSRDHRNRTVKFAWQSAAPVSLVQ